MKDHEYDSIKYFQSLKSFVPSQRLLKYRLNIILLCAAFLFYLLSDFKPDKINFFFMQGAFKKHYLIDIFLLSYLGYNWLMFYLIHRTESEKYKLIYSFRSFVIHVARYIFSRKIEEVVGSTSVDRFELTNDQIGVSEIRGTEKEFLGYDVILNGGYAAALNLADTNKLKSVGIVKEKNRISFPYSFNEEDEKAYESRRSFFLHSSSLVKADILVPYVFIFITISVFLYKKLEIFINYLCNVVCCS